MVLLKVHIQAILHDKYLQKSLIRLMFTNGLNWNSDLEQNTVYNLQVY